MMKNLVHLMPCQKMFLYIVDIKHTTKMVILGRCQEIRLSFLPRDGKTPASDALIQVLREGRQPGLSLLMATQQPGEVHSDVITQSDVVISHRVTAKADIDSLNNMMQTYLRENIQKSLNDLPKLKGSAIVLDDNSERVYPIMVRPKLSWHGGEEPSAVKKIRQKLDLGL